MRVLVTGGAGFIGRHLVKELLVHGHHVVVMDNLRRGSFEHPSFSGAEVVAGDVRDAGECRRLAEGCDAIFHLAAQSNVMGSESDPDYTFATNVVGTWNIARAAALAGVERFVFTSSREVYGDPASLPVSEEAPTLPKNTYGASKLAGEALLRGGAAGQARVAVLRLANVIGPGDTGRVVPNWLSLAQRGLPLQLFGGSQVLDFLPMEMCIEALTAALELDGDDGPVNVGSGQGTTLRTLADRVSEIYPQCPGVEVLPAREAEVTRFVAAVERMHRTLRLTPPPDPLAGLASYGGAIQ